MEVNLKFFMHVACVLVQCLIYTYTHTHTHSLSHIQPSRPPPALLHIPETSSALPPQSRVSADSGTSSVIQQAPSRSQQATPTTTVAVSAPAATATAQQLVTTPIATPSVMFHPNILAAAALQQQANQSASSNPGAPAGAILTPSSAPSVMEALQQQLALGSGASVAATGATATPAVNPFGAALVRELHVCACTCICMHIYMYVHVHVHVVHIEATCKVEHWLRST